MRQSEFKKKYDHDIGKYTRQHIYGEGIMDTIKSFLGKKPTKKVRFAVPPPPKPNPVNVTKNAGDKIVQLLSSENPSASRKMSQQEINNRMLQIMSGSGRKK